MEKIKNSFKGYQDEKVAKRLIIIDEQLKAYKKKKVKFKNITELAIDIANEITKKEENSCSSSTILRNERYKTLIEDYYYSQEGVSRPSEANNLIVQLTSSNLERENHRLKQYITNLEKELDDFRGTHSNNVSLLDNKGSYLNSEEASSANLTKALNLLVKHFEGLVAINEKGDLIDLTKKVNNIIVKKENLK